MSHLVVDLEFSWCIPEDEAGDKILTWHHHLCFSGFNSVSKWSLLCKELMLGVLNQSGMIPALCEHSVDLLSICVNAFASC